jgi:hypothetical protein
MQTENCAWEGTRKLILDHSKRRQQMGDKAQEMTNKLIKQ